MNLFSLLSPRGILIALLATSNSILLAQVVVSAPTGAQVSAPARPGLGAPTSPNYSELSSAFAGLTPFARWGSMNIKPYVNYQLLYGDGILRVPGEPTNTTQQSLMLGTSMDLGKHLQFDYHAARTWYSTRLLADNTSHSASLSGGISMGNWHFGGFQRYASTYLTLVETGQQTPEKSYSTGASASYQIGQRTLLDVSASRSTRESELGPTTAGTPVPDVEQWSGTGAVHYRISPKLDVALGVQVGYDSISISSDMRTTKPQLTVNWRPTAKLSFTGTGGIETRKFETRGFDDLETKVYDIAGSYQPTVNTRISASANRSVSPSYFENQVSNSNGWAANVSQRIIERLYVTAGYQYGRTTYLASDRGFQVGRDDDFESFNARLSTTFLSRGSISLTYQRSQNSSTNDDFKFTSHQVGTEIEYRF